MHEYDVSFYAAPQGGFSLDVHDSSGTSPYLQFRSLSELRDFFESLEVSGEKLAEIESICRNLRSGTGYHEKMFLPQTVLDGMEQRLEPSVPSYVRAAAG